MDTSEIVGKYVEVRDRIKEIKDRHKAELVPYNEALESVEALLMKHLHDQGADSIKTANGTAYKSRWTKAAVQDWQATLDYVIENERWDLLERRVSKSVVEEIGNVPGIVMESGVKVNVRRS